MCNEVRRGHQQVRGTKSRGAIPCTINYKDQAAGLFVDETRSKLGRRFDIPVLQRGGQYPPAYGPIAQIGDDAFSNKILGRQHDRTTGVSWQMLLPDKMIAKPRRRGSSSYRSNRRLPRLDEPRPPTCISQGRGPSSSPP